MLNIVRFVHYYILCLMWTIRANEELHLCGLWRLAAASGGASGFLRPSAAQCTNSYLSNWGVPIAIRAVTSAIRAVTSAIRAPGALMAEFLSLV